jgi:UDP-N-acetylmuramyl tripeptide synthase
LITNVSADHLGRYGIDDVATMVQVKAVVARVARTLVLNAGDPALVALGGELGKPVTWFGGASREGAWTADDGMVCRDGRPLLSIDEVPLTFGGRAPYNVENALAAAALATALGLPEDAVIEGLRTFTSSPEDNPGRGNVLEVGGAKVILDFGHNPAAVRGVIALARSLAGEGALRVTIGMPGDRPDEDLIEVAAAITAGAPAQVVVRELPAHLRGRAHGEVPARLAAALGGGVAIVADELTAVRRLLAAAEPGDVLLVLVHLDPAVEDLLRDS